MVPKNRKILNAKKLSNSAVIYMPKCPECDEEVAKPTKEWDYGPKNDPKRFRCQYFKCSHGHGFTVWNLTKK